MDLDESVRSHVSLAVRARLAEVRAILATPVAERARAAPTMHAAGLILEGEGALLGEERVLAWVAEGCRTPLPPLEAWISQGEVIETTSEAPLDPPETD